MLWDESADDLILAGAAGLEIPNAGRFILGANVVTQVNCALTMRNDLVFSGGARNIKFKDNTYNACRFQANNGDIFMGMDTQGDNTIFFQQPLDINTSAQIDGTLHRWCRRHRLSTLSSSVIQQAPTLCGMLQLMTLS